MTSTTAQLMATDGVGLLTRHWPCETPLARVLIVHGIGEHSGRYEHVGEFLVEQGFDVFAFDQRGHGASGGNRMDLESFEEFLDDLEVVLGETQSELPMVIYGHSMGALIATSYGASQRPQPDLYVLSAPALDAEVPMALRLAVRAMNRIRPGTYLPNSIKAEQISRDPSVGEKYFADPLVQTKATARFGAIFLAQLDSIKGQINRLTTPTLVIHGADDELVPPHAAAPLAALPDVERKLFPGLRHETHNEPEKDAVLGFVATWLKSQLG